MKCSVCIITSGTSICDALTILDGQAMCGTHVMEWIDYKRINVSTPSLRPFIEWMKQK